MTLKCFTVLKCMINFQQPQLQENILFYPCADRTGCDVLSFRGITPQTIEYCDPVIHFRVFATTTKHHGHHTGPTHPPAVHETFAFRYDPVSSTVLAKVGHKCYLYKATGSELTEVHTPHGLHTIEMAVIKMIDDNTATYTRMTTHDMTTLSKTQSHLCTAHNANPTIFKLNF